MLIQSLRKKIILERRFITGEIDITQGRLEEYADVFADICNVLLFNGEERILPEQLMETGRTSQYKADDGSIHQEDRDVAKYWKNGKIKIALFGLENQMNKIDYMPRRIIGYDGASYRSQLLGEKPYDIFPVITLVLYYGTTRWDEPISLFEELKISEELKPLVNDYKINLYEIAFLEQEQVKLFKSDFRVVADYFVQKRMKKKYIPTSKILRHVDEVLKMLAALSGDDRFVSVNIPQEKGVVTMCEIVDGFISQGLSQGLSQGEARTLVQCVEALMASEDITASEACEKLNRKFEDYEKAKNNILEIA